MKFLILALLPLTSFAGNDGPSADPQPVPPSRAVLTLERDCGLFCPNATTTTLAIEESGRVLFTRSERGHTGTTELVAQLSTQTMKKLLSEVNALKPAELVDYDSDRPMCEDAGMSFYRASPRGLAELTFAQNADCHMHGFASHAGDDLVLVLNGLEALTR